MSNGQIQTGPHPLKSYCDAWIAKIEASFEPKRREFQQYADAAMAFFDGACDEYMWGAKAQADAGAGGGTGFLSRNAKEWMPTFRMTYNRMFEVVALFAPSMYFQNPTVLADPHLLPQVDPMLLGLDPNNPLHAQMAQNFMMQSQMDSANRQQVAGLFDTYLNWLQDAAGKRRESRRAITEVLIKGASYLWTDVFQFPGSGGKIINSTWVSVDDVFKDQDATSPQGVTWMVRRRCLPVNVVASMRGLPPGSLKGNLKSYDQAARDNPDKSKPSAEGRTHDLLEYYEVYSKNGFGQMLSHAQKVQDVRGSTVGDQSAIDVSVFGKYCYLEVAKGVPYPLNLPSEMLIEFGPESDEVFQAVQWPWPAWQEEPTGDGWPCTEYALYDKPKSVWPMGLFKSVAGEMKFINWMLSFLADRAAAAATTIIGIAKQAMAEIKRELLGANAPFTVVEIAEMAGKSIQDVISFLNAPAVTADVWTIVAAVDDKIDKRLGLTELIYGLSKTQMRSAEEARVKDQAVSIRPDDMANSIENCLAATALKEAQCAFYNLSGQDVMPVLGQLGAAAWDKFRGESDPDAVVHSILFSIEAGSSRKPNRSGKLAEMMELGGVAGPIMQQLAAIGQTGPWNGYIAQVAKLMEVDPAPFQLPQFQPPGVAAEQEESGAEDAKVQQEMMNDQQRHDQEMDHDHEKHEQDMKQSEEMLKVKKATARASASRRAG